MFQIVDLTNLMESFIPAIEKELGVQVRYTHGHQAHPAKIDPETFLKYRLGEKRLWVVNAPMFHLDAVTWGMVYADKAVVSTHDLTPADTAVVIMHELGHLLGLNHCHRICLMASVHPAEAGDKLCSHCHEFLRRNYVERG